MTKVAQRILRDAASAAASSVGLNTGSAVCTWSAVAAVHRFWRVAANLGLLLLVSAESFCSVSFRNTRLARVLQESRMPSALVHVVKALR